MNFMGVDPGKHGAIAVVGDSSEVQRVVQMPILVGKKTGKKKSRDEYDIPMIAEIIEWWAKEDGLLVTVERSAPIPTFGARRTGSLAQFNRGVQRGFEWMLVALDVPYQLVPPNTWMKAMHIGTPKGDTKQRSILAAQRLFPGQELRRTQRCRKPDDGIAEALLLAEFGRRTRNGGTT